MLGLIDIATRLFFLLLHLWYILASDENEMKVNWANLSLICTILRYTAVPYSIAISTSKSVKAVYIANIEFIRESLN